MSEWRKKKELSDDLRILNEDLHWGRFIYETIIKTFHFPITTEQSIIEKFQTHHTIKNSVGRGNRGKLPVTATRNIKGTLNETPIITSKGIFEKN